MIFSGIGAEVLDLEWTPKTEPGTIMRRYFRKEALDKIAQAFTATFMYRTYRDGKLISEENEPLKMSWYTYPHLRVLFLLAGLEIVEEYGSFAKAPLDNHSEQMIFLLKKGSEEFPSRQAD